MMRRLFALVAVLGVAACATPSPDSWVEGTLSPADTEVLAGSVVQIARQRLPAASSTLVIAPPTVSSPSPLPEAIADGLRKAGFAVAASQTAGAHPLRYMVTTLDGQLLLRLSIDATMTAQLFGPDGKGHLAPVSPQSVQKAALP